MKCPACWSEKAYLRNSSGIHGLLVDLFLLSPLKCHHCYHKFSVLWFMTLGKEIHPPKLIRLAPETGRPRPSIAASSVRSIKTSSDEPMVSHRAA